MLTEKKSVQPRLPVPVKRLDRLRKFIYKVAMVIVSFILDIHEYVKIKIKLAFNAFNSY